MNNFCSYKKVYSSEQEELISKEFHRVEGQCYLEHAGATLYSKKQIENVYTNLSKNVYSNPHAKNTISKQTEDIIDVIRYEILSMFNADPEEYSVIFTSGATAALKLVGETFSYENPEGSQHGSFVYLQDNHTSVLGMREYCKSSKCLTLNDALKTFSDKGELKVIEEETFNCNCLFAYPAQSNFSGTKYPLNWITQVQDGVLNKMLNYNCLNWFTLLDAASFVSTNKLDLSICKPDFITISFYKMFGYPTGLGALLAKNSSSHVLKKKYFGGGTVLMSQTLNRIVIHRNILHEKFEDGSLPFLSIVALKESLDTIKRLNLNFKLISQHTFSLAQYVYNNLICLHHSNGKPIIIFYHNTTFENSCDQGGIINFNLLRSNGEYIGYSEVLHFANLYGIHLRTGCFCNPGACQHFLNLSTEDVDRFFEAGHVCGDQYDLVDGCPTGSVRISFGYMSTKADADTFLDMIEKCFIERPVIKKIPADLRNQKAIFKESSRITKNNDIRKEIQTQRSPIPKRSSDGQDFTNLFIEKNNVKKGILQQIFLYPIKSCGAFSPNDEWPITSTGLKYDRQWMIINSNGACVTQKNYKNLCLIRPFINIDENILTLHYPGFRNIHVPLNFTSNFCNKASLCQSKVCGDKIQGWDCGDEVADWLMDVLDCGGLRLLKQCTDTEEIRSRSSRKNESHQLSLTNNAQYLLINVASVEWLRDKVVEDEFRESLQSTLLRFRPNFIVSFAHPFVENDYKEFIFEDKKFESGGTCTRCQMICIDQKSGETSKEPLQTLSKEFKGKISFGIYLNRSEFDGEEFLKVGCTVIAKCKM